MRNVDQLSRRERQIMEVLFTRGEATVLEITEDLPEPPTPMAVRRMLHILVEKGHLKRRQEGREMVYAPREARTKAGTNALQGVLETFFGGSLEEEAGHLKAGAHDRSRDSAPGDPDAGRNRGPSPCKSGA